MDLSDRLLSALTNDPAKPLFDYKGRTYTRQEIADLAERAVRLIDEAGVPPGAKVGVIARNRVLHAAAMLGLISHGRTLTNIYSMQSPEAIAAEVRASHFGAVIADAIDWNDQLQAAAADNGSVGLVLNNDAGGGIDRRPGLERAGPGPFTKIEGEPGLEILSSGTTGKPKRIQFPFRMLSRAVESVMAAGGALGSDIDILTWPYGGIGGMTNLVANTAIGRHTVILEKFNVPELVEALRRYRPKVLTGPPAVARMVLDAKVPAEDLSSVEYFFGGSAAMPPDLQEAFEQAYDLRVIWAYGATEFCGTIISWTPALYESHGQSKKGSMGRPLPGIQVRAVDVNTGEPLPPGEVGYLEAVVPAVRDGWIRTTDLVEVDADGFIFHRGRGDGAILRGGFKVLPEKVVEALHKHPSVLDAAVVGLPDARLGEAPVAAVELRAGAPRPTEQELHEHAKRELVAHHVPVKFLIVDKLPRTTSLKVDLGAVKRLFQEQSASA